MEYFLQIAVFIFGTIIGSFLNVVILRYGRKSLTGRSVCPNCGKKLQWFELVPLVSFFFLGRKCRGCQQKISWQYPLVEIVTGILFLTIFNSQFPVFNQFSIHNFQFLNLIILWVIFSLLIVIFVYDFLHKIIPDLLVFLFIGLSVIPILGGFDTLSGNWWNFSWGTRLWAGPVLALPFAGLWFFSKGKWIGLGDAKLAWGIGWLLGFAKGLSAIILGVWLGALVGLLLIFLPRVIPKQRLFFKGKNFTMKSELPFAPFLIIGLLLVVFLKWDVWSLGSFFNNF